MNRDEAKALDVEIRQMLINNDCNVNWALDTGTVVMKRNGEVKFSYSERESMEKAIEIKDLLQTYLTPKYNNVRIRLTNMLETYRPEVKVTVVIG